MVNFSTNVGSGIGPATRAPVRFTGHVASGPPALVHDEAAID